MRLKPELSLILSGIQDVLIQAAQSDGFKPNDPFKWNFDKLDANNSFEEPTERFALSVIDFSIRENFWKYEKVLFSDTLKGTLDCDTNDIYVSYNLKDSYKGIQIGATLRCYIKHPDEYRQALIDAGALTTQTNTYETVQCGV